MGPVEKLKNYFKLIRKAPANIQSIKSRLEPQIKYDLKDPRILPAKLLAQQNALKTSIKNLHEVEFQVFSQWGDDGIIQYLINKIDIPHKTFIEFGVENYTESNTRFLTINDNWSGLVMDGSPDNVAYIKEDPISWAHELHARDIFITKENINDIIRDFLALGYDRELGILSVDIDGNDYWVWDAIDTVNPVIVIAEYNSVFGPDKPWTIPYESTFYRLQKGNSIIRYGVSLLSLCDLADKKGYDFIGCNSAGNNAYFVRKDKNPGFKALTCQEGFVTSKFRELQLPNGFRPSAAARLETLRGTSIYNTRSNSIEII